MEKYVPFLLVMILLHDFFPDINADLQVAIWNRDGNIDDHHFDSDVVLRTTASGSIECAVECLKVKSCRSITFRSSTKACLGYSKVFGNITDGVKSSGTEYLIAKSVCGAHKSINKTIASEDGLSEVHYRCDFGYKQSGQITSRICQPSGAWSQVDIECAECDAYARTFKKRENKYFGPPYSHVPSHAGTYSTIQEALDSAASDCITETRFLCRSFYFKKNVTDNYYYYVSWPMRVYDDVTYWNYYKEDPEYDEYIRDCQ